MFVHLQEHKHRIKILINQTETKLNINRWIFSARPSDWTNLPIWALYQVLVYPCQVGHFYSELLIPSTPWVGAATQQSSQVSQEFNKWYLGRFPIPGSHPGVTPVALASYYLLVKGFCPGASHGGRLRSAIPATLPSHYRISKLIPTQIL